MGKIKYIPSRGDIVWIDFDPVKGHEQSGRRPALVLSPEKYNAMSKRALICPVTSKVRGNVFEVVIEGKNIRRAILSDQIRTMDWSKRNVTFAEQISPSALSHVEAKLLTLIQS